MIHEKQKKPLWLLFFFRFVELNVLHIAPLNILFAWFHLFYVSHRQTRTTVAATRTRLQLHRASKNTVVLHRPVPMKCQTTYLNHLQKVLSVTLIISAGNTWWLQECACILAGLQRPGLSQETLCSFGDKSKWYRVRCCQLYHRK